MASVDEFFVVKTGLQVGTTSITALTGVIETTSNIVVGSTVINGATGDITVGGTTINGTTGNITSTGSITVGSTVISPTQSLANVAYSGSYNDLSNKPAAFSTLATTSTAGLVTVGSNISVNAGAISIVSGNVISALGYTPVNSTLVGNVSGIATLDSNGKVPLTQINSTIIGAMNYQGTWNATTNLPAIVPSTGTKGHYYTVATAGNTTIDGNANWTIGDIIAFNGTKWDQIQGAASDVVSVAGLTGTITAAGLATALSGQTMDISGTATTATNATNSAITNDIATATAVYPTWVTANTGNLPAKVSSTKLSFVPSTGVLTATSFTGAGTGLTGSAASLSIGGSSASCTGNAATATSAGNADTVDTYHASMGASNSTVAVRDANGFLFATYYNSQGSYPVTANANTSGMATFTGTNGADNFARGYTNAAAAAALSGQTMNINGSSTSCTGNAATATTATNATNRAITNDVATATSVYPTWASANTGNLPAKVSSTKLSFVPSTGVLTATSFTGAGTGLTGTAASLTAGAATTAAACSGNTAGSAATFTSTTQNSQFNSIGVGTAASTTAGEIRATNNITAYYSDDRLKTKLGNIEGALDKLCSLNGFYYEANETAQALGYEAVREIGVSAQEVNAIFPEIVAPAPIDEKYMTVRYERLAPLFIEAIKELRAEIAALKGN